MSAVVRPSTSVITSQTPERSGLPSPVRGAGAVRFGFPSAVRGIPGVRYCAHCLRQLLYTYTGRRGHAEAVGELVIPNLLKRYQTAEERPLCPDAFCSH